MDEYIVVIGGGEIRYRETISIDEYICNLVKTRVTDRRANALFVGTASHDYMPYYNSFHKVYTGIFGLKTDCALTVHIKYGGEKLKNKFDNADLIYIGGGDTIFMLNKWSECGIINYLLNSLKRGAIICGLSAGAVCWFEKMYTDGLIKEGVSDKYKITDALGILKGGACPHFNLRATDFISEISKSNENLEWYAIEDNAALIFKNGQLEKSISCGGNAYKIKKIYETNGVKKIFTEKI